MTDGSKKRLGGWTRLWLVFSAVWVVGCSVVFFNTAPERDSVELSLEELDQYRVDQIVQAIQSGVEVQEGIKFTVDIYPKSPEEVLESAKREGEAAVIALAERFKEYYKNDLFL